MWLAAAMGSALFAGLTAILAKLGVRNVDSDVATALRSVVILAFAWLMVFVTGSQGALGQIGARPMAFLVLSGLATGASWICYFRALSLADVNRVTPIDKLSTVLGVLLAIVLFDETQNLLPKLAGTAVLTAGSVLMALPDTHTPGEKDDAAPANRRWLVYVLLSAVFAALTTILAKVGLDSVESNLATALRTIVVVVMGWVIVLARGKGHLARSIDRKTGAFIALSGVATGASWLCYYYAVQNGPVSAVIPIDKASVLVTVAFSCAVLHERLGRREAVGLALLLAGILLIATWS